MALKAPLIDLGDAPAFRTLAVKLCAIFRVFRVENYLVMVLRWVLQDDHPGKDHRFRVVSSDRGRRCEKRVWERTVGHADISSGGL